MENKKFKTKMTNLFLNYVSLSIGFRLEGTDRGLEVEFWIKRIGIGPQSGCWVRKDGNGSESKL